MSLRACICVATAVVLIAGATKVSTQDIAPRLREATLARTAGQIEKALSIVDGVLAQSPANEEAARLKVGLLLDRQRSADALVAYDTYMAARRRPDAALLAIIATAELRRLAQDSDQTIRVLSLERLARAGDVAARKSLQAALAADRRPQIETLDTLGSLARLGDKNAEATMGALLPSAPADGKVEIIEAIQNARARSQAPNVAAFLTDGAPEVRMAAARAVGVLQAPEAVPQLQQMFDTDLPSVKMIAAIALKRLGQSSVDAYVAELLASEVTETRLLAGEAYQNSKSTQWVPRVRELRLDRNEQHRVRVADLLACCDVPTATALLTEAVRSPIPLLRRDAARVLEARALADAAMIRRLLGDSYVMVRLYGAGAALRAVQATASR